MILTTDELQWVKERMKIYDIKYQEIYDEILDHIITAIEERRTAGNNKDILVVFQNVVDEHFNGYIGIESLAVNEEKLYRKNIRSLFYQRLKKFFNWQTFIVTLILLAASYMMPNIKQIHLVFMVAMILLAFAPVVYAQKALAGKVKTIKGKRSLLKTHIVSQAAVPIMILQPFFFVPNFFDELNGNKDFHTFNSTTPVVLMLALIFVLITSISYVQSCKEIIDKRIRRN
jgi:hypothetical protein